MLGSCSVPRAALSGLAAVCLWLASPAQAQSAANVAVIINESSPESKTVGEYYARTRSLPTENVLRIQVSSEDTIERGAYVSNIEGPIAAAIRRGGLQDRLLYLVLTKGVPLRIVGTTGPDGSLASVDSELTLLYRRMTGNPVPTAGRIDNPYYLGARHPREARPFTHRDHDIYLVTRLDAFTTEEALSLVDRAQTPARDGRLVLHQRENDAASAPNQWIAQATERLAEMGHGDQVKSGDGPVLGFYTWGSIDPARRQRTSGLKFVPGAIAGRLAASDARTFKAPPDSWTPSGSSDAATFFAGSSETLAGDLIRDGVTGVSAQIAEPYLGGAVRPEILFPAYLAGFNLVEAFYLATPALSWTTIIVGDPLCRPFSATTTLASTDLDAPIDAATELPEFFSRRRVARATATAPGIPDVAVTLTVRAENRLARGDRAGAREAFERALAAAPAASGILLALAQLEEGDKLYDAAIGRYRRLLELQPANVIALNNLAYALTVYQKAPGEALPIARRAAVLAPGNASILDTLGWIEHLLGNHTVANDLMTRAIKIDPTIPELRLHAAEVAATIGDRARAESELKEALRLSPSLDKQDEVRRLRERIAALPEKKFL
jgi:uncharacterized protein (TIGR03790 family)